MSGNKTIAVKSIAAAISILMLVAVNIYAASQIDIAGPAGSGAFGSTVTVLPNGNYVVNASSDSVVPGACANGGAGCSLRGAIQEANTNPNADSIIFAIPASDAGCSAGVCTINLVTVLPTISTNIGITGAGFGI